MRLLPRGVRPSEGGWRYKASMRSGAGRQRLFVGDAAQREWRGEEAAAAHVSVRLLWYSAQDGRLR